MVLNHAPIFSRFSYQVNTVTADVSDEITLSGVEEPIHFDCNKQSGSRASMTRVRCYMYLIFDCT